MGGMADQTRDNTAACLFFVFEAATPFFSISTHTHTHTRLRILYNIPPPTVPFLLPPRPSLLASQPLPPSLPLSPSPHPLCWVHSMFLHQSTHPIQPHDPKQQFAQLIALSFDGMLLDSASTAAIASTAQPSRDFGRHLTGNLNNSFYQVYFPPHRPSSLPCICFISVLLHLVCVLSCCVLGLLLFSRLNVVQLVSSQWFTVERVNNATHIPQRGRKAKRREAHSRTYYCTNAHYARCDLLLCLQRAAPDT